MRRVIRQVALGAATAHYFDDDVNRTSQFKDPNKNIIHESERE